MKKIAVLVSVLCGVCVIVVAVWAQGPPKTASPSSSVTSPTATVRNLPPRPAEACCGYNFPRELDAEIADPDVHRVHYDDAHVMLIEVSNPPLLHVRMHGHPFISVFAHDSNAGPHNPDAPHVPSDQIDVHLDPNSSYNDMGVQTAAAPAGLQWPTCNTAGPQAPHEGPFNTGLAPTHFYRLEFLRVEGDEYQAHWREWYPETTSLAKPVADLGAASVSGPRLSPEWPYPIAYDSIFAAPNNYKLLFEDGKIRLLEVTIRSGETTPMHGHPYPTVLAYNGNLGDRSLMTEMWLDPTSPLNGKGGGHAGPPKNHNLKSPTCGTAAPESPHTIHNGSTVPLHYYRLEYKRIDGDQLVAKWKTWYPWMQFLSFMR